MGCSYHSAAVIGVRLDKLYTVKKEKTFITKYDENTGKPYQHPVITEHYFWCDKEVEEPDYMEGFVKSMCGLELHTNGHGEVEIVGTLLGKEVEPGDATSVTGKEVSSTWTDVKDKLQKSGYTDNGIELHILAYVAC